MTIRPTLVALASVALATTTVPAQVTPTRPVKPVPATAPTPTVAPTPSPNPEPAQAPVAPQPRSGQFGTSPARFGFDQFEVQQRALERAQEAQERMGERVQEAQQRAEERARNSEQRAWEVQARTFGGQLGFGAGFSPKIATLAPVASTFTYSYALPSTPREPWVQGDPADSLYRAARSQLDRGDYRKAAAGFKEIPQRFQYSAYVVDAMYWQAYSLYRIGSTPDLQEALGVLDALKQKYPSSRSGSRQDVTQLTTRVAGVLSSRGLGGQDVVKRVLAEAGSNTCDGEEQSVKAQALSALMETDAEGAAALAQKMLGKKDECSVQLRRNAVMVVARKRDAGTLATLTAVAKSDPSSEVRQTAVRYLASMPGDDALPALEDLLKMSDDQNVQREAVSALARHTSPRARQAARAIIERNDANESLRLSALRSFDRERSSTEDAAWLRSIYPKVDNTRVKAAIIESITRIGGDGMDSWLLALAKNENESVEARSSAVRRAAQTMDIASLGKFYDAVAVQRLRSSVIDALSSRREPETVDKLVDIAKNGTDPQLRREAISALARKDDPRAKKALLDLIDR